MVEKEELVQKVREAAAAGPAGAAAAAAPPGYAFHPATGYWYSAESGGEGCSGCACSQA